jgi:hypothetical protein
MRNEKTRKILGGFLINPQVKFEYPVTAIATPTKSMIVLVDMEQLGENSEDFNPPFGIIKTDILLSVIDSIQDAEIEMTDSDIIIKNDTVKQKIRKSPANIFMEIKKESAKLVEDTFDVINEVDLSEEILGDILKRAKLLGHDTFVIKEGKIITGRENGNELEDESETIVSTNGNGEIKLNIIDILKIPVLDYKAKVYSNGDISLVILYPMDYPEVKVILSEKLN